MAPGSIANDDDDWEEGGIATPTTNTAMTTSLVDIAPLKTPPTEPAKIDWLALGDLEPRKVELPVRMLNLNKSIDFSPQAGSEQDVTPLPVRSVSMPDPCTSPLPRSGQGVFPGVDGSPSPSSALGLLVPSPGSAAHGTGNCKPCAWFWKPKSCLNARDCSYCHLCPEGEIKLRKKVKVATMRSGHTPKAKGGEARGMPNEPEPATRSVLQLAALL